MKNSFIDFVAILLQVKKKNKNKLQESSSSLDEGGGSDGKT
jgi:hypothetical protein